jgi:hypothetical protein
MKRLLVLTILSVIAASTEGCRSRGAACRPMCVAAPTCCPAPACGGAVEAYSTPGVITTSPGIMLPAQTVPGPETYVPATN